MGKKKTEKIKDKKQKKEPLAQMDITSETVNKPIIRRRPLIVYPK